MNSSGNSLALIPKRSSNVTKVMGMFYNVFTRGYAMGYVHRPHANSLCLSGLCMFWTRPLPHVLTCVTRCNRVSYSSSGEGFAWVQVNTHKLVELFKLNYSSSLIFSRVYHNPYTYIYNNINKAIYYKGLRWGRIWGMFRTMAFPMLNRTI